MLFFFLVLPLGSPSGWELGPHRQLLFRRNGDAFGSVQVAQASFGTAVDLVITAYSLWHWAAAELSVSTFTAAELLWTLRESITAQDSGRHIFPDAGATVLTTAVALGAAVFPVEAGDSLGQRTAAIFGQSPQAGKFGRTA